MEVNMTDDDRSQLDEETLPDTPLHAYKEGREEDVEGDVDKLKSGDQHESQRSEIEDDDTEPHVEAPPKH
jgi:hypothetical protein